MAQQLVDIGSAPNDHTGNTLRASFDKVNDNFTELYSSGAWMSDTVFAGNQVGATDEDKIEAALDEADADGKEFVLVPLSMIPFDAGVITQAKFANARLIREGGRHDVFDISAYGAPLTGDTGTAPDILRALQRANYAAQQFGGGEISLRHQSGAFYVSGDFCNNLNAYDRAPITTRWGPAEYRIVTTVKPVSHHHWYLNNTTLIQANADGSIPDSTTMVHLEELGVGGPGNGVTQSIGSATWTKVAPASANWARLERGSPIATIGKLYALGSDDTLLDGAIDDAVTTLVVDSTVGLSTLVFGSIGLIRIENELISFTGSTGTTFTGCTRGYAGTTAASHANNTPVYRVGQEAFVVDELDGDDIVLNDRIDPRALGDFAATNLPVYIGVLDFRIDGHGVIDGQGDPFGADDTSNPVAVHAKFARRCYFGPGILFRGWDHGGPTMLGGQDNIVLSSFERMGNFGANVGTCVWLFGGPKRNYVHIPSAHDCAYGVLVDDRSTTAQAHDGSCDGNVVIVDLADNVKNSVVLIAGGNRNTALVRQILNPVSTTIGVLLQAHQWVTNVGGDDNVLQVDAMPTGNGKAVSVDSFHIGKRTTVKIGSPAPALDSQDGVLLDVPDYLIGLTYGVTVTPTPARSRRLALTITDGVAFAFANPATTQLAKAGYTWSVAITNSAGGAHGTITLGGAYKSPAGATTLPAIANGKTRRFEFEWNGSFHYLVNDSGDLG